MCVPGRLPWLGAPKRNIGGLEATLTYRSDSEGRPSIPLRLEIEINTREHQPAAVGGDVRPFAVDSRWFDGAAKIRTFELSEILGTKPRARFQRRKATPDRPAAVAPGHERGPGVAAGGDPDAPVAHDVGVAGR